MELSQGFREPPKPHMLEAEGIDEENRLAVLFSRLLLTDLRRNVSSAIHCPNSAVPNLGYMGPLRVHRR